MRKVIILGMIIFMAVIGLSGCAPVLVAPAMFAAGGATVGGTLWVKKSGEKTAEGFYSLRVKTEKDMFPELKEEVKKIIKKEHYRILTEKEQIDVLWIERDIYKFRIAFYEESYGYRITIRPPMGIIDSFKTNLKGSGIFFKEIDELLRAMKEGLSKKFTILS